MGERAELDKHSPEAEAEIWFVARGVLRRGCCGCDFCERAGVAIIVPDPTFKNTEALHAATGITLEISKKEEEDPRLFFLPLSTEELYRVHVKNENGLAVPSGFSPVKALECRPVDFLCASVSCFTFSVTS